MPVIEPVVLSLLEEVGVAVIILESIVDIIRNPLPVGNRPERKMRELWLNNHFNTKNKTYFGYPLDTGGRLSGSNLQY